MRQARDRQRESIALSGSNPGKSVANIFRHRSSSKRGHELPPLLNDNKVFLTDDTDKAELFSDFFAKHLATESDPVPFVRSLSDRTLSTIDVSSDLIKKHIRKCYFRCILHVRLLPRTMRFFVSLFCILVGLSCAAALECYECSQVAGNTGPCTSTRRTCRVSQDACISFVQYRTPDFWTILSERRPFISKGCTSKMECASQVDFFRDRCYVNEIRDWTCANCCFTDNCNYNVPNQSEGKGVSFILSILFPPIFIHLMRL
ncbi:hypothetical protein SprV_0902747400 [Sparganum proliferum]